jgi:hypothetical protein
LFVLATHRIAVFAHTSVASRSAKVTVVLSAARAVRPESPRRVRGYTTGAPGIPEPASPARIDVCRVAVGVAEAGVAAADRHTATVTTIATAVMVLVRTRRRYKHPPGGM